MTVKQALSFVRKHGIVLMSARGSAPNLAQFIVGGIIRGSWWAHPKSHEIYRITTAVSESPEVLVCKLVDGRVTLVHRRLWPALARISHDLPKTRIAAVQNEHTPHGHHRLRTVPFTRWLPKSALKNSQRLTKHEATVAIGEDLVRQLKRTLKCAT